MAIHPFDQEPHRRRVEEVAARVRARAPGQLVTVRKSTPTHTMHDRAYKKSAHAVDVSHLSHVLDIDTQARVASAEGQVCVGALCEATLRSQLLPKVVPEFPDFTVAGLVAGEGIQTSSHIHGLFSHTLEELEAVTGDGRVVRCSPRENADLWKALPSSHGCLGIVTAARISLRPARRWVASTYHGYEERDAYLAAYEEAVRSDDDFVEGVVYGPRRHALVRSRFVDEAGSLPRFDPDEDGGPYYFQHVRAQTQNPRSPPPRDVLEPLAYLRRSVRGLWWMVECHTGLDMVTDTRWGRRILDRAVRREFEQHGVQDPSFSVEDRERCLVHQDMGVRLARLGEYLRWVDEHLGIYPLWNCGLRLRDEDRARFGTDILVDVGIYGEPTVPGFRPGVVVRALQRFADAPSYWGVSYLTREELIAKRLFDADLYDRVRAAYGAEGAFTPLEEKIKFHTGGDGGDKIPAWRLHRTFGAEWRKKPAAWLTLGLGTAANKAWAVVRRVEDRRATQLF
jgi:delta24-sterol reductase